MRRILAHILLMQIVVSSPLLAQKSQSSIVPAAKISASSPWIVQSSGVSVELLSVKAVSATVAWACGASGVILRTTNGGTTWSRVDAANWTCVNVDARDASNAWVVAHDSATSNSALFKTTDGGKTWTQPTSSNDPSTYWQDVRFFDSFNGIIVGNPEKGNFLIYTTTDGGSNWTPVPATNILNPSPGELCQPNNVAISGNSVWFSTRRSTTGFPRVFHSTDKGKTWVAGQTITGLGSALPSVAFSSETIGLVAGALGTVVRSINAGVDWSNPINTQLGVGGSLDFASPSAVVLMSAKGECAVSVDSGLTWRIRSTPDTLIMRRVSFSPSADGWAVGNKGTIWKWAGESLGNPPSLVYPHDEASNVTPPVNLSWQSSAVGGTYRLQIALDSLFNASVVFEDSLTTTSTQVGLLAYNATYYWRVRSENSFGFGPWSTVYSFNMMTTKPVQSTSVNFPPSPSASTDYRLVSFPGASAVHVDRYVTGTQKTDWRIFRENGKAVPNNLVELASTSSLSVGQGYWFVQKGPFSYSTSVTMPQLSPDGTYAINLDAGWNIIGNPFDAAVSWDATKKINQVSVNIWTYVGAGGFKSSDSLAPFQGYYFYNGSGATELKLRYPFPAMNVSPAFVTVPAIDWKIQLALVTGYNSDLENLVGIAPSATTEADEFHQLKPPVAPDQASVSITRSTSDGQERVFSSDFRPALGEGQVWSFSVSLPKSTAGKLRIIGVETIPVAYDVVLVSSQTTVPIDLRKTSEISFQNVSQKLGYSLIVGTQAFIGNRVAQLIPTEFELGQNYPNPFNPSTSITYKVPRDSYVKLEVISILGQHVATLAQGNQAAGVYTAVWNAADKSGGAASSGVYFFRLVADGKIVQTKKMMLLK